MREYVLTVTVNPALDKFIRVRDFAIGTDHRSLDIFRSAGGKGINVSRALKSLHVATLATGFIGGQTGTYIFEALQNDGIPSDFVAIPDETRTCLTIFDVLSPKVTRILEKGPCPDAKNIGRFRAKFKALLKNSILVVISGSNADGIRDNFYKDIINCAHQLNKKVIFDSSGTALLQGLKAKPFMIKLNREEAAYALHMRLFSPQKKKEALVKFLRLGIKNVYITLGKEGAVATDGIEFLSAQSPSVIVKNTVGCGDAFLSGYVFAHLKHFDFRKSLAFCVASATANASGVCPGGLVKTRVVELARHIQISAL